MMMCNCKFPKVDRETHADPVCRICGLWWNTEYGSNPETSKRDKVTSRNEQRAESNKIGRNALCVCGSNKKYKKCCG